MRWRSAAEFRPRKSPRTPSSVHSTPQNFGKVSFETAASHTKLLEPPRQATLGRLSAARHAGTSHRSHERILVHLVCRCLTALLIGRSGWFNDRLSVVEQHSVPASLVGREAAGDVERDAKGRHRNESGNRSYLPRT